MSMAQTWLGAVIVQVAQQVREHPVPRMRLGGPGLLIERLDAHPAHQRRHMLAADRDPPRRSRSRSIRLPAKGCSRCSSSIAASAPGCRAAIGRGA